ncbi:MAG: hypothetical protein IKF18_01985 [Erysipelotrichaceae bacterium]|nr:hypothetical protein [Erysipelotrichaceae bacterium]
MQKKTKFILPKQLFLNIEAFGVKDIFDESLADFRRTAKTNDDVYISEIEHKCRLKIDEKGCEGVAQTVAYAVALGIGPDGEYDFILNRPFIVIVHSIGYCPLFLGVVNNPC